jgi:hypothetical protein
MKDTIRLKQSNKAGLEALGYHDANEAIAHLLESRHPPVQMLQKATHDCNGWKPDEAYWARFRDEVREAVKPPKLPGLVPASTLKTIGKIEPGERLEEPVGRQGRAV